MSTLASLFGVASPIKSVQRGHVVLVKTGTTAGSGGTDGLDGRYVDITISAVDMTKCLIFVQGGFGAEIYEASAKSGGGQSHEVHGRFISPTILRVWTIRNTVTSAAFTWQIVEYN